MWMNQKQVGQKPTSFLMRFCHLCCEHPSDWSLTWILVWMSTNRHTHIKRVWKGLLFTSFGTSGQSPRGSKNELTGLTFIGLRVWGWGKGFCSQARLVWFEPPAGPKEGAFGLSNQLGQMWSTVAEGGWRSMEAVSGQTQSTESTSPSQPNKP